tara:strand:- start:2106 stop:2312 length:207 start_codon:yes stop_codon:yes gene_type:complete
MPCPKPELAPVIKIVFRSCGIIELSFYYNSLSFCDTATAAPQQIIHQEPEVLESFVRGLFMVVPVRSQ